MSIDDLVSSYPMQRQLGFQTVGANLSYFVIMYVVEPIVMLVLPFVASQWARLYPVTFKQAITIQRPMDAHLLHYPLIVINLGQLYLAFIGSRSS